MSTFQNFNTELLTLSTVASRTDHESYSALVSHASQQHVHKQNCGPRFLFAPSPAARVVFTEQFRLLLWDSRLPFPGPSEAAKASVVLANINLWSLSMSRNFEKFLTHWVLSSWGVEIWWVQIYIHWFKRWALPCFVTRLTSKLYRSNVDHFARISPASETLDGEVNADPWRPIEDRLCWSRAVQTSELSLRTASMMRPWSWGPPTGKNHGLLILCCCYLGDGWWWPTPPQVTHLGWNLWKPSWVLDFPTKIVT